MRKILAALALLTWPGAAAAGLTICNQSDAVRSLAIGYKDGEIWKSEGWWTVAPGACTTPMSGELANRYYYLAADPPLTGLHARTADFCVTDEAFTITGADDCTGAGHQSLAFREIDTGTTARNFTFVMIDLPAPGSVGHGEPYAADAVHQGCEPGAGPCAFHADGTKVFVYADGGTPPDVMATLRHLNPGAPVVVSGRLTGVFDTTAEAVLDHAAPRAPTALDTLRDHLQGTWYAIEDPDARITFVGSERIDTYDGQEVGQSFLQILPQCDMFDGGGPYLAAREPDTGQILCYAIDRLQPPDLELTYLPGGRALRYRRLD